MVRYRGGSWLFATHPVTVYSLAPWFRLNRPGFHFMWLAFEIYYCGKGRVWPER